MNKILLVARREFLTRVQKKTFLLTTIGLPLLIFGLYALIIFFTVKNTKDFKIAVADNANIFKGALKDKENELIFSFVNNQTKEALNKDLESKKFDAYIFIPSSFNVNSSKDSLQIVAAKSVGFLTQEKIERRINSTLEQTRLLSGLNISKNTLDSLQRNNKIVFSNTTGDKQGNEKSGLSYIVGLISGFLIYIILFVYGSMVMRGVMEEKTNRIAEVIVSSVKPFQLMMGKIFGIGSVGLVQFLIWIVLVFSLQLLLPLIFPDMLHQMQSQPMQPGMVGAASTIKESGALDNLNAIVNQINFPLIIGCFLFYFLGGYFMYASLFAAVGSTVNEDPQDAQSLILPITMPIIFAMVIMMQAVNEPNSPLSIFGSLFPLTSPIVMMARIAHGIPDGVSVLQLLLSMFFLVAGFVGTTWFAGKIYRTGILMYGKKVTWKEIMKWAFRKG